jgi:hypothetical protein
MRKNSNKLASLKNIKLDNIFIDNDGNVLAVDCEWNGVGYRFPVTAKSHVDAERIYEHNDEEINLYKDALYIELINSNNRLSDAGHLSPYYYNDENEIDDLEVGYIVDYHYDDQLSV